MPLSYSPTPQEPPKNPPKPQKRRVPICRDEKFSEYKNCWGRHLGEWSGVLNGAAEYRFILRCQHTRFNEGITNDPPPPHLPDITHDWHAFYQDRHGAGTVTTLFHHQEDLGSVLLEEAMSLKPQIRHAAVERVIAQMDECAKLITDNVALIMTVISNIRLKPEDKKSLDELFIQDKLFHHSRWKRRQGELSVDAFWVQVIEKSMQGCPHIPDLQKLRAAKAKAIERSRSVIENIPEIKCLIEHNCSEIEQKYLGGED